MKKKIISLFIVFAVVLSTILILPCEIVKSEDDSQIIFSDDFEDNNLDTDKWTMSINGSKNAFEEKYGVAKFTSYGHKGWDNGHTVLWSKILSINNWNTITVSGKWRFPSPDTAEMRVFLYDADNMSKYAGVTYATWTDYAHEHLRLFYSPGLYEKQLRNVPDSHYVDFQVILTKDEMQYWENDVLINTVDTTTLSDINDFKLQIGGWDHSSYYQYFYYDDISISTDGWIVGSPPIVSISSPVANQVYYSTQIWINASANKEIDSWYYSLDNAGNVSFNPNIQISVPSGSHDLTVYGVDDSGNYGSASVSFNVESIISNTAIVGVESTTYGVSNNVGDLMSVHVIADSSNGFMSDRLYLVDIFTNETIELNGGSVSGNSIDKAIVVSVLDVNDSVYDLFYEATDISEQIVATGYSQITVKNAVFDITNVQTTFAERIYVTMKASLGTYNFADEADHFPEDEKGSFVYVTVENTGLQGGAAKIEIILPDYLHSVADNPIKYIYLNSQETKQYTFYILLAKFNLVDGWSPSDPTVFPENKQIPIEIQVSHFPSYSIVDTQSANIGFNLGPIFYFEGLGNNLAYIWEKNPDAPDRPYDGDGDSVLEAGEGHHFNIKYKNIGDETATLKSVSYLEYIPCDSTKYWPYQRDYGYITNVDTYYPTDTFSYDNEYYTSYYEPDYWDERNTYIFGELYPEDTESVTGLLKMKYFYNGRMDWWPDDINAGLYPPLEYSGDVYIYLQPSFSIPTDTSKPYGYYSCSINKQTINVEALEKTFTPTSCSLKDGDINVEVYSVDIEKNTTQIKLTNNNEYVYFEYKLDSYYDDNPEGYKWYHTVPPEYKFNVFTEARDPSSTIPHMKAIFGVQWSVWANELKLGLMTLEAAVNIILQEVTGGALEVEFADTLMGVTNTLLQIRNVYESYQQGVPPTIRINGVTVDLQELADQGLNRQYFTDITNGDIEASMITTLVDALWENDELKEVVGREILKVIANNLGLKGLYDLMMDEDAQEQAFDDLLEKLLDYLADSETITKAQSDAIGNVVSAAKTFMDLGEWAYNNAVSIGAEEIIINIIDPPGEFTTEYEIEKTNYFGGPYSSESTTGEGNIKIALSGENQVKIDGEYTISTENLPVNADKIKHMTINIEGQKTNNKMSGTVNIEIIPKPDHALDAFIAFRNPSAQKNLISTHFETLESISSIIEGDKIIITGSGILKTSEDDSSINNNLIIDENGLTTSIEKTGSYIAEKDGKNQLNLKFKPVNGIPLDDTALTITVEEGARFESDLPFEKQDNTYYLSELPEEITANYIPAQTEQTDNTILMIFIITILLVLISLGFAFYKKHNKK